MNGAALLSERAAFMQLGGQGHISANGSCRLLQASDGWIALNLARDDDWDLMPAWLESVGDVSSWQAIAAQVASRAVPRLLEQGRLMGLPVAAANHPSTPAESWFSICVRAAGKKIKRSPPLVIDLSSLWAGPLCTHLLLQTGARVIEVESKARPDGARRGNSDVFDLLNGGKESAVFDLSRLAGVQQLVALLKQADIVVEGSRPRALQQLGIDAEALVKAVPGLTWVSITGYGRREPGANWVAFGDDAAVAAGVAMANASPPLFCGDALADPLTGIHAALAAMAFWQGGGGVLLDLNLHDVTAHCLNFYPDSDRGVVLKNAGKWQLHQNKQRLEVCFPTIRRADHAATFAGSDTDTLVAEFNLPC
jgi:hypothetical protein